MNVFEHFIQDPTGTYVGNHVIVDMWGIINHMDQDLIMDTFAKACEDAGATVLFKHCHTFGEDCGTTGVVVLSESHLSHHHYPEVNLITIDMFMCGVADPRKALPRIKDFWQPQHVDFHHMKRGIVTASKLPAHLQHQLSF